MISWTLTLSPEFLAWTGYEPCALGSSKSFPGLSDTLGIVTVVVEFIPHILSTKITHYLSEIGSFWQPFHHSLKTLSIYCPHHQNSYSQLRIFWLLTVYNPLQYSPTLYCLQIDSIIDPEDTQNQEKSEKHHLFAYQWQVPSIDDISISFWSFHSILFRHISTPLALQIDPIIVQIGPAVVSQRSIRFHLSHSKFQVDFNS